MTPEAYGQMLAEAEQPITDEQADAAARILLTAEAVAA